MSDSILVALIGLCGSGVGSLLGVVASARLTQYRLEQLEKKVQAHNSLIDRTYRLEEQDAVHTEQIKVINHRLKDLEGAERP